MTKNDKMLFVMTSYFTQIRNEIQELLPQKLGNVLDVGCGNGTTSSWLKSLGCERTIGIEFDPDAVVEAQKVMDLVYQANIEGSLDFLNEHNNKIDLLLLMDILEHIRDPWGTLTDFRDLISTHGCVIASIPNVRNLKVVLPLVFKGSWNYASAGILDRTHLRFFTKKSIIELFNSSGYDVVSIKGTGPTSWYRVKSKAGYLLYFLNIICCGLLTQFITHQYLRYWQVNSG